MCQSEHNLQIQCTMQLRINKELQIWVIVPNLLKGVHKKKLVFKFCSSQHNQYTPTISIDKMTTYDYAYVITIIMVFSIIMIVQVTG